MRSRVSLEVERVVETFPAEGAQVPLDIRVTLHVPVQQSLEGECLVTNAATEL